MMIQKFIIVPLRISFTYSDKVQAVLKEKDNNYYLTLLNISFFTIVQDHTSCKKRVSCSLVAVLDVSIIRSLGGRGWLFTGLRLHLYVDQL